MERVASHTLSISDFTGLNSHSNYSALLLECGSGRRWYGNDQRSSVLIKLYLQKQKSGQVYPASYNLPTPGHTNIVSHPFFARFLCCEHGYGSESLPSLRENDKMHTEVGIWGLKLGENS